MICIQSEQKDIEDVVLPDNGQVAGAAEAQLLPDHPADLAGGRAPPLPDHGQAHGLPQLRPPRRDRAEARDGLNSTHNEKSKFL